MKEIGQLIIESTENNKSKLISNLNIDQFKLSNLKI